MAFKLAQALLGTLGWPAEKLARVTESFLKIVALGTVADVVPLTGENRIIVKHGLAGLGNVRNPGLRALLDVAGFTGASVPTAGQVAFRIAPRMNAAGRMDTATAVIELFLTADAARARAIAAQLDTLNQERQRDRRGHHQCDSRGVPAQPRGRPFGAGLLRRGLAPRRAGHRGESAGGALPPPRVRARDGRRPRARLRPQRARLPPARGARIHARAVRAIRRPPVCGRADARTGQRGGEFRERLDAYAAARLSPEDFRRKCKSTPLLDPGEIDERAVEDVLALAPFGCGNPAPLFAALDVEVAGPPAVMKMKHLRVTLRRNGARF